MVGNKIRKYKLDFKFFNNNILNKWPISINKNEIIFEIGFSLQWKSLFNCIEIFIEYYIIYYLFFISNFYNKEELNYCTIHTTYIPINFWNSFYAKTCFK